MANGGSDTYFPEGKDQVSHCCAGCFRGIVRGEQEVGAIDDQDDRPARCFCACNGGVYLCRDVFQIRGAQSPVAFRVGLVGGRGSRRGVQLTQAIHVDKASDVSRMSQVDALERMSDVVL